LGQLLQVILDIKHYIFNLVPSKPISPKLTIASIAIDHQMVVIHVQVGKNFIEDVLLDGDSGVNIITEKLRVQLGLSKPKLAPYNLHLAYQTIAKPLGLIKDLRILVHGIPYVVTFTIIQNSLLNSSHFVSLSCPWLRDVKVSHDWGNNIITIQGAGTVKTILVTKKLEAPTKHLEILVCYDFHSKIFDKEEDLMFAIEQGLFSIGIIVIPTLVWLNQPIKLITSACLNLVRHANKLVEHVSKPLVSFDVPIKSVHVRLVKIVVPLDTFQQHLSDTFFQLEVGEMEIDKMLA